MSNTKPPKDTSAIERYFASIEAALAGLNVFLTGSKSPLNGHLLVAQSVVPYVERLSASFDAWRHRLAYADKFRISRSDSGFPVFQNTLELDNDRRSAPKRLAALPDAEILRGEMADFILRHKAFPHDLRKAMAERLYLEAVSKGDVFSPYVLPETIKVSVNPKTKRPFYMTHWGVFDGTANLPLIYSAIIEDSSKDMVQSLVTSDGKMNDDVDIPIPVGGLLNHTLARRFDQWADANAAYSLSPATVAINLDEEFETLHPKQLRRIVLGPFYSAGITEHNETVNSILERVAKPEHAWLLTWTVQDVFSKREVPGKRGLWSSTPTREEFHIDTDNLEAARMGVSEFEKHALVPHEAYQALYAAGEADALFGGYRVHIISGGQVVSDL
ncbi:MAG: hypothetical protein AAGI92_00975 [Pseudomonadota bacterium]